MNTQEKIEAAGKKKEEGNLVFKAGKYARASKRYEKVSATLRCKVFFWVGFVREFWNAPDLELQAAKYIDYDNSFSEEEKKQSKALKISCNLNNAACKLKLKEYKEAVKLCTKVWRSNLLLAPLLSSSPPTLPSFCLL